MTTKKEATKLDFCALTKKVSCWLLVVAVSALGCWPQIIDFCHRHLL